MVLAVLLGCSGDLVSGPIMGACGVWYGAYVGAMWLYWVDLPSQPSIPVLIASRVLPRPAKK